MRGFNLNGYNIGKQKLYRESEPRIRQGKYAMKKRIGWADPEAIIGEPRTQMVGGFTYLFAEEKHVKTRQVKRCLDRVIGKAGAGYTQIFPGVDQPPLLVTLIDDPVENGIYDVRAGFVVRQGTQPVEGIFIEEQPPALIASILVNGPTNKIVKSYGPLMQYMNQNAMKCVVGWREWYLYYENDKSSNNIIWVQHLAEKEPEVKS